MMTDQDMAAKSRVLCGLMQQKLNVRGRNLAQCLRRAGRQLPKSARTSGATLVQAEMLSDNPKTARQVDVHAVDTAYEHLRGHLAGIDVGERRKARLLSLAAAVVGNLIVVVSVFVVWLWWRGYI